jgi:hypothetical protein
MLSIPAINRRAIKKPLKSFTHINEIIKDKGALRSARMRFSKKPFPSPQMSASQ